MNAPSLSARWNTWRTILSISLSERLVYRGDFAVGTLMRFLPIITQIFLWHAVFQARGEETLAGFTYKSMVAYYLLTMLTRAFSSMPGLASGIARQIRDGEIKKFLIQPIDLIGYLLLTFCCNLAKAARARACSFSRPVVASHRYTLAADTFNCRANWATESPNRLRRRATDLPVGRVLGGALAGASADAWLLAATWAVCFRLTVFRFAFLETLGGFVIGVGSCRAAGRVFFSGLAEAVRLLERRRFVGSACGAGGPSPATSRSMPKISPS